jgi:hypothetical protein
MRDQGIRGGWGRREGERGRRPAPVLSLPVVPRAAAVPGEEKEEEPRVVKKRPKKREERDCECDLTSALVTGADSHSCGGSGRPMVWTIKKVKESQGKKKEPLSTLFLSLSLRSRFSFVC